jgi:pimeloyl-ACP methyl ester carboxylesterase
MTKRLTDVRSIRRLILAVPALALLAVAVGGCTIESGTDEGNVSTTASTYLRALARGDSAGACAQLTPRAQGRHCEAAMKARLSRLESDALSNAADGSLDIDVDGSTAAARLSEPDGARFALAKVGARWRIDSGYTLASAPAAKIPTSPVGRQISWALDQLNGGAARLSEADVSARFKREFLAAVMPASDVVASLAQTAAERGPFTFTGFASPPTATKAIALIQTRSGKQGSVRIEVDGGEPDRILRFEITEAPPRIEAAGPYSGRFSIGARKLFLHCTGSGSPTVVFQGGLTTDWAGVQDKVARVTRACSYDPANGVWGRSDPARTPRTARDVVADLHALLAAAKVPGPYVLAGHSDGGLFAQLYASTHAAQVKGLVLIDAVHQNYYARRIAMLKTLLPPNQWHATVRALRARQPAIIDPEQIDLETSLAQTRAALATAPLHPMPLFVLTRGHPDQSGSQPRVDAADERLWRDLQDEIATLVPHSVHVTAKHSGHDIHHQRPELVVSAIHHVVQAIRDPTTWKARMRLE